MDYNMLDNKLLLDFNKLPANILISTMTITCKCGTNINLENVSRFIDLNMDGIRSIKYGIDPNCTRFLVLKKKKTKKGKVKKSFFNQATLEIKPIGNEVINVKLFKNGAIQMTGCKSMKNVYEVLNILLENLKIEKAILVDNNIIEKTFVENPEDLKLDDLKIVMINSNFTVPYSIDREKFYKILIECGTNCTYEPCIHACVNIKYMCGPKKISIFVFQSGAIIITGANNVDHIILAYDYINAKLQDNSYKIIKKQINTLLENNKELYKLFISTIDN
jgi:TATA-box binding protein (TBP) (component of TFIID and TFIIIB)